ncbi:MAG: hypothetical protein QXS16_05155 [Pyrobaculum sp.]
MELKTNQTKTQNQIENQTKYLVIRNDRIVIITDDRYDALRAYYRRFPTRWRITARARHLRQYGTVSLYLRFATRAQVAPGIYTSRTIDAINASDRVKKKLYELLLNTKVERTPPPEPKPPTALIFRLESYVMRLGNVLALGIIYERSKMHYKLYYIRAKLVRKYGDDVAFVALYESRSRYIAIVGTDTDVYYVSVPKNGDFAEIRKYGVESIQEILNQLIKYEQELPTPMVKLLEHLKTEVALNAWESI